MNVLPQKISRRAVLLLAAIGGIGAVLARLLQNPPQPQSALAAIPTIISRAEWGALPPNHDAENEAGFAASPAESAWYVYTKPLDEVYNTVVIHHSDTLLIANETMPSLQRLHLEVNKWADVAYHFAIDKNGNIYEGRDIHVRVASVAGHNTGIIGVVVMGNFELDHPLDIQLGALQTLIDWLRDTYTLSHLAGHGEFNPESICPGKNLAVYLDQLAQGAKLERGTAGYVAPV
jgi:hypothetical protein